MLSTILDSIQSEAAFHYDDRGGTVSFGKNTGENNVEENNRQTGRQG